MTITEPASAKDAVAALCPSVAKDERIMLVGLLAETAARLQRTLGGWLESECGLPLAWYEVLVRIVRSPEGRLTMSEVADKTVYTSGGTTRLVDRIEEAGLLQRAKCPSDRRTVYVEITEAGAAALAAATVVHLSHIDAEVMVHLDDAEHTTLIDLLTRINEGPASCTA